MRSPILHAFIVVSAALLVLAGTAGVSRALMPQEESAAYEVPLAEFDLHSYSTPRTEQAASAAVVAFTQRYGGTWEVYSWNPQTRTPAHFYGSGVDVAPPFAVAADVEAVARRVITENAAVFRADPENLRLHATPYGVGKWAVHFQQTYEGLDVWGGRVHLTFMESGRLFAMGSQYYSGISLNRVPSMSASAAEQTACNDLPFDPVRDSIEGEAELLVLPVPLSETQVEHHLIWRVRVRTWDPIGIWVTHVDAHSGEILWRYNDVHFVDFEGDAEGQVEPNTWCNGVEDQSLKYMRVEADGAGWTYTDQDGNWTIPYGGDDDRTLTAILTGPYIYVNNTAGPDGIFEGTATPGVPFHVDFTVWWAQRDELDCFDAINDIHDFIMLFDPGFGFIHQRMTCNVSLDATCNAFWDGTINFYRMGNGCANTGQIQGVVHHEYGHGIQHFILGWQGDEGLGEANADFIANLMTQESIIGRGFYLDDCDGGIRDSDNDMIYPDSLNGGVHHDGQILAGFHWDVMVCMQDLYGEDEGTRLTGENWHFCRVLEHPTNQPAQVLAAFIADDDDGDLTNGTPHYDCLSAAAEHHTYEYPEVLHGVQIAHTPLLTMTEEGDAEVIAEIYSVDAEMNPDSVLTRYRLNGGDMLQLTMTPTGGEIEYHAFITDMVLGDIAEYYIRGVDVLGNSANDPENAPDDMHTFGVATVYDPLEEESGWIVDLEGTDTAVRGIWVREDPVGTRAQPEDDHTPEPGVICWVTGNGPPGYPPGAYDIDYGVTSVYSPSYDMSGAETAVAGYWRWFSNDGDANPYEDYWGVWVRNNGGDWNEVEYTNEEDMNQWIHREVDLIAFFGAELGEVQFKFAAADTGGMSMVEACVDDLEIIAQMEGSDVPEYPDAYADTPRFALYGSRSVPVVGHTELAFQVPADARVRLDVFDVNGRMVRSLADDTFAPGVHSVAWDARDAAGRPVASGVYYCRMQTHGFDATRTLVVSR